MPETETPQAVDQHDQDFSRSVGPQESLVGPQDGVGTGSDAPSPAPAVPEGWTGQHTAWANSLGVPLEKAYSFGSPDAFLEFAQTAHRAFSRPVQMPGMQQQQQQQPQIQPPGFPQPGGNGREQAGSYPIGGLPQNGSAGQPPQLQQPPAGGQPQQVPQQFQLPRLDADEIDESIVKWAGAVGEQFTQQQQEYTRLLDAVGQLLDTFQTQTQSQVAQEEQRFWDKMFNGLDETRYGKGAMNELPSHQIGARETLKNAVLAELYQRQARGDAYIPPPEVLVSEIDSRLSSGYISGALSEAARKSQQLAGQALSPPRHSPDRAVDRGTDKAVDAVRAQMIEKGMI